MKKTKEANLVLEQHLRELGLVWQSEWRFNPPRRWRADYVVFLNAEALYGDGGSQQAALVEIEGAVYARGRHTRGKGFENDCEKYNHAQLLGHDVFRFSTGQVLSGKAKEFLATWKRGLLR